MAATASQEKTVQGATAPWEGFQGRLWQREINVRAFIQTNYTPYDGDEAFLAPATARTQGIWKKLTDLFVEDGDHLSAPMSRGDILAMIDRPGQEPNIREAGTTAIPAPCHQ